MRDLLRIMRNKRHHFHELQEGLKKTIGPIPTGFCNYFEERFPHLLLHCVKVAQKFLRTEKVFVPYFRSLKPKQNRNKVNSNNSNNNADKVNSNDNNNNADLSSTGKELVDNLELDDSKIDSFQVDTNKVSDCEEKLNILNSLPNINQKGSEVDIKSEIEESTETLDVTKDTKDSVSSNSKVDMDTSNLDVVVWQKSALEASLQCKGWWRDGSDWVDKFKSSKKSTASNRPTHLTRSATDLKYRTRLCTHWENTDGSNCPMRKKGKCIFAHGPIELRVKETRRDRWGKFYNNSNNKNEGDLRSSGGEDILTAARSIEKVRVQENKNLVNNVNNYPQMQYYNPPNNGYNYANYPYPPPYY